MLRLVLGALAVGLLATSLAQAAGAVYRDPFGQFEVLVPEGWEGKAEVGGRATYEIRSPRVGQEKGGLCGILVRDFPPFKGLTQAQVDEELAKMLGGDFWQKLFSSERLKDASVLIEGSGGVDHKGRKAQYAVIVLTPTDGTAGEPVKMKMMYHGVADGLHAVVCVAPAAAYTTHEPQFESIFASYEAKSGLTASLPRVASTALLNVEQLSAEGLAALIVREQVKAAAERAMGPAKGAQLKAVPGRAVAGTVYRDPLGRFVVTVPEGWSGEMGDGVQAVMVLRPSGTPEFGGGGCAIGIREVSELKGKSQAEVDAELEKMLTPEAWNAAVSSPQVQNIKVVSTGAVTYNGRKAFFGVATASVNRGNGPIALKAKLVFFGVPGNLHSIGCSAKAEVFEAQLSTYDSIYSSYEPKRGEMIVGAPPTGPAAQPLKRQPLGLMAAISAMAGAQLGAAADLAGRVYRDPKGLFAVTVPEGWTSETSIDDDYSGVGIWPPGNANSLAECSAAAVPSLAFGSMTQAEIDALLEKLFDRSSWETDFAAQGYRDSKIESTGIADYGTRKGHYGVGTGVLNTNQGPRTLKTKVMYFGTSSYLHAVVCAALVERYAAHEPAFESIFASYVPRSGNVAVSAPGNPIPVARGAGRLSMTANALSMAKAQLKTIDERFGAGK